MPSFTVNTPEGLYKAVKRVCAANGYNIAFALRTGLKMFLAASHEERIQAAKKYPK